MTRSLNRQIHILIIAAALILFAIAVVLISSSKPATQPISAPAGTTETPAPAPSPTNAPTVPPSPSPSPTAAPVPARLNWSASRPLTWDDFRGKVPSNHGVESAQSFTEPHLSIKVQPSCQPDGDQFTCTVTVAVFSVTAQFSTRDSWVDSTKESDRMLDHEQGHFDITEVYARKMRAIATLGTSESATASTQADALAVADAKLQASVMTPLQDLRSEETALQTQYDSETDHSQNASAQSEWRTKINQLLGR